MKTRIAIVISIFSIAISSIAVNNALFAQDAVTQDESLVADFTADEGGWRITDFQPYITAIRDLEKLNRQYAENVLRLAIDEFSTAIDILEDMDEEIAQIIQRNKEKRNLNEQWYWQEIDRKNQEYREISNKKREAKLKAVTYLHKAIMDSDEVQNVELRNEPRFNNFLSKLYQTYVATQYDLQNLKPCISIIERYIKISDKNSQDPWAYRYLASCCGYMEKTLERYKYSAEDELMMYRNKKNKSMLYATELLYGIDSPHYKRMQELVRKGERKSVRINDFN